KVKKEKPILVILGNPPYSGISANASERKIEVKKGQKYVKGYTIRTKQENGRTFYQLLPREAKASKNMKVNQKTWIGELIEYYKIVAGTWLKEKNPKMLQDDYVKFIRFSQWKIDKSGEGAIGLITNRSYIENITFPGMRESLIKSFDQIFILDLHGDLLRRQVLDDGTRDENIFDITKGVAIIIALKIKKNANPTTVLYAEIKGTRDYKYNFLRSNTFKDITWQKLQPTSPDYVFIPRQTKYRQQYSAYPSLDLIFPVNLGGVKTHRDHFVIDANINSLVQRLRIFLDYSLDNEFVRASLKLKDTGNWKLSDARNSMKNVDINDWIQTILYRPFNKQYIFYHDSLVDRSRRELVQHMLPDNVSLIAMRQVALDEPYNHFFVSDCMVDARAFYSTQGIIQQFPLYLYHEQGKSKRGGSHTMMLFEPEVPYRAGQRISNIIPKLLETLQTTYRRQPSPEDIFNFIYAVFYSNAYRKKYAEFLKTDFPRVPFTKDSKLFQKLAKKGAQLVELHLLKSEKLSKPIAKCEGSGDLRVVKVVYDAKKERVHINPDKYFTGVPSEVWEYHIGGYQVAEKWLKDRKGRIHSSKENSIYTKVITSIAKTIEIQESLDELFKEVESHVLDVKL
ncbi:MAG: type ISP restriction/modification enzyme, partial [bacterium]